MVIWIVVRVTAVNLFFGGSKFLCLWLWLEALSDGMSCMRARVKCIVITVEVGGEYCYFSPRAGFACHIYSERTISGIPSVSRKKIIDYWLPEVLLSLEYC